jgi:hypothetical protein
VWFYCPDASVGRGRQTRKERREVGESRRFSSGVSGRRLSGVPRLLIAAVVLAAFHFGAAPAVGWNEPTKSAAMRNAAVEGEVAISDRITGPAAGAAVGPTGAADASTEAAVVRLESARRTRPVAHDAPDSLRARERDQDLARARAARAISEAIDSRRTGRNRQELPDPLATRALAISIEGYEQAVLGEAELCSSAGRGGKLGQEGSRFAAIWNEMAGHFLDLFHRWPALWSRALPMPEGDADLPVLLLSFCTQQAFRGDAYDLPRECLTVRMATLPESLAACCIDAGTCREAGSGAGCSEFVAGFMAASIDQDAMTGFHYGAAYWALPRGIPPRSPGKDNRVAAASVRYSVELLEAGEVDRPAVNSPKRGSARGSESRRAVAARAEQALPAAQAIALIRASGKLWPPTIDPFTTVPGLRNPRWGETGVLLCDVALYRACVDALNPRTRAWLSERLTEGRKIILVDPR